MSFSTVLYVTILLFQSENGMISLLSISKEEFVTCHYQCTVTCGQGLRYRVVLCIDHRGLHAGGCNPTTKPHIKEECLVTVPCYKSIGGCVLLYLRSEFALFLNVLMRCSAFLCTFIQIHYLLKRNLCGINRQSSWRRRCL